MTAMAEEKSGDRLHIVLLAFAVIYGLLSYAFHGGIAYSFGGVLGSFLIGSLFIWVGRRFGYPRLAVGLVIALLGFTLVNNINKAIANSRSQIVSGCQNNFEAPQQPRMQGWCDCIGDQMVGSTAWRNARMRFGLMSQAEGLSYDQATLTGFRKQCERHIPDQG